MANGTALTEKTEITFNFQITNSNPNKTLHSTVEKIAQFLKIDISKLSFQDAQDNCFAGVYALCKEKKWSQVKELKNEVETLVDTLGRTLLGFAMEQNDKGVFDGLVANEICLTKKNGQGDSPLHIASALGKLYFAQKLLLFNKIDEENVSGLSSLHLAAFHGHLDIVNLLLNSRANSFKAHWEYNQTVFKVTPLELAVIGGKLSCVERFFEMNQSLPRTQNIGNLLHLAIFFNQNHVLEKLLTKHHKIFLPLIEEKNERGQTPLMLASFLGNVFAVNLLIKKDAKLDSQDDEKLNTALHWAISGNQTAIVQMLVKHHARADIRNKEGLESDQLAKKLGLHLLENYLSNVIQKGHILDSQEINYIEFLVENLVFKGGGPKAIAFIGALLKLEEKNMRSSLKRTVGTSGGAIFAILYALNFRPLEIQKTMDSLNLMELLDHPYAEQVSIKPQWLKLFDRLLTAIVHPSAAAARTAWDLLMTTGICKGDKLRDEIEKQISKTTGIENCTFKELRNLIKEGKPFLHFHGYATRIGNPPSILHFSTEDSEWDDYIIADAVCGSSSIPGVFQPRTLRMKKGKEIMPSNIQVVDGGLLYNLGMETCDRMKYVTNDYTDPNFPIFNKKTLGLSLYSPEDKNQQPDRPPTTLVGLIKNLIALYSDAESLTRGLNPFNESRIVPINNCGVTLLSFNLKEEKKQELIESGKVGFESFFQKLEREAAGFIDEDTKKEIKEDAISYTKASMQQVGATPGFYVYGICNDCNKAEWVAVKPTKEIIDLHKVSTETCCSGCRNTFSDLEKMALVDCSGKMSLGREGNEETVKHFTYEKGMAHIIHPKGNVTYLQFEIKD